MSFHPSATLHWHAFAPSIHNDPATDVHMTVSDDDAMDVQPKLKPRAKAVKLAERPVTKNSQRQATIPNEGDQCDLAIDKGPSTQKSNQIRKFFKL